MAIASFISQRNCATKLAKRLFETLIKLNKIADVILEWYLLKYLSSFITLTQSRCANFSNFCATTSTQGNKTR